jgi:hypothetical protein
MAGIICQSLEPDGVHHLPCQLCGRCADLHVARLAAGVPYTARLLLRRPLPVRLADRAGEPTTRELNAINVRYQDYTLPW